MGRTYIGLDIGGTMIRSLLISDGLKVMGEHEMPLLASGGRTVIISRIIESIRRLDYKHADGVGVGFAGRVDDDVITFSPNIPKLAGVNLRGIIESKTGKQALIENDAACFAVAEHQLGAGRGLGNMVGLIIGTGIGAGIIINSSLYKGKGGGGEVGHMMIDPSGIACGCGKRGDFESWCSGRSIVRRYIQAGGRIAKPEPAKIYFSKEKAAVVVMKETIDKLGVGLSNISAIFDPEMIILGGGVSNLPFLDSVRKAERRHSYAGQHPVRIEKSRLKNPGAIGAALIARMSASSNDTVIN